jgi:hypothetical protein
MCISERTSLASDQLRANFRQSTFLGTPLSTGTVRALAHDATPRLSPEGEFVREALARVDGETPLAQLAAELASGFPDLVPSESAGMDRLRALMRQYAQTD